jgi:menaquinone-9 beta-reductase
LNLSLEQLPPSCDVLVVGAGPAGSAVAIELARQGLHVVLIDQHTFPRDKVCGDAIIADAHAALERLGVLRTVQGMAQAAQHVRCVAPRGGQVAVPGVLAVLPRRILDDILCRAAVLAGAYMVAPARFVELLQERERVVGARVRGPNSVRDITTRWVVLATGAVPQALMAAGMCEQPLPNGVALRGYVQADEKYTSALGSGASMLDIVWHRELKPGYGWLFPCGQGLYNIGVGVTQSHQARQDLADSVKKQNANLRDIFKKFTQVYAPARQLMKHGKLLGELKGAPLRFSLKGARCARPGLLVTGEAVGSTYSLTGEGIGKAMETGILAAQSVVSGGDDHGICATYTASLNQLKPRFELYERANQINNHPWMADLLIWRARHNPKLLERMSRVLNETSRPGNLLSWRGLWRLWRG